MTPLYGLFAVAFAAPSNWHSAPPAVAAALDAARQREVLVDPSRRWAVEVSSPALGTLGDGGVVELAGLRLDPVRHLPAGLGGADRVRVWPVEGGPVEVALPSAEAWLDPQLAPDGSGLLLTRVTAEGLALWVMETETWTVRPLTQPVLHRATGPACEWLPPGEGWICKIEARQVEDPDAHLEHGPRILGEGAPPEPTLSQDSLGVRFRRELSSQLVWIRPDLQVAPIGEPALWVGVQPSPDGRWLATERWQGPFEETDVYQRLPLHGAVLDRVGRVLGKLPATEPPAVSAMGAVPAGARRLSWRPDRPATLVWVEAQDQGDPTAQAEVRDVVYLWPAPFTAPRQVLWRGTRRFGGLAWGGDSLALVTEWWWADRTLLQWRLDPEREDATGVLWTETSGEEDPGTWLTDATGRLVRSRSGELWRRRRGTGDAAAALQRIDPDTGRVQKERLLPTGQQPVMLLDDEGRTWVEVDETGAHWIAEGRRRRPWIPAAAQATPVQPLGGGLARWVEPIAGKPVGTLVWLTEGEQGSRALDGATPRWLAHAGVGVLEVPLAHLDDLETLLEALGDLEGQDAHLFIGGHGAAAGAALEVAAADGRFQAVIARSGSYRDDRGRLADWLDRVEVPVLWVHGGRDARTGFGVEQAKVAFELMRRRGVAVRWVELPEEDHGYLRRPSVEHVLWEMHAWMARWRAGGAG